MIKVEGMKEVLAEIEKLDDRLKRMELLKILRRQVKPMVESIRSETPVSSKIVRRYVNKGSHGKGRLADTYDPGNLKKSIKIKTGKSRGYPNVMVGPNYGGGGITLFGEAKKKKNYDGYYAFFVTYGYAGKHRVAPNDFVYKGAKKVLPQVESGANASLEKYIQKKIKSLNL